MIEVLIYITFLVFLISKSENRILILGQVIFYQLIGYLPFIALGIWDFRWIHTVILLSIFLVFKIQIGFPFRVWFKNLFHIINISIFCILLIMLYHLSYSNIVSEGFNLVNKFIFRTYFLTVLSLISFSKLSEMKDLVDGIVIGGVVTCLLMIVQFSTGSINTADRMSVLAATQYNPITVARTMGVILFVSVILLLQKYNMKRFRLLYIFNICSSIYFILITSTRAVIISLLVIFLIYFLYNSKSFIEGLKFVLFVILLSSFGLLLLEFGNFSFIERFEELSDYETLARYDGYLNAIKVFEDNMQIGAGPSGYYKLTGRQYPHNLILEVLSEYGILGIIFLLIIVVSSFKIVLKKFRKSNTFVQILKILWIYFFLNTMTSGYISSNREFWILCAILVSIYNLEKRANNLIIHEK